MLVKFTTEAYADITMFGDIARTLLKMMGHSTTIPSAILTADVPNALQQLTVALESENTIPTNAKDSGDEPTVSLANRALPLINLLTAAVESESNVMWE